MLGGLEDFDQAVALGIDAFRVFLQRLGRRDGVLRSGDVVGADHVDNVDIFARSNALGLASSAQETVGGAFALGIGTTCRADDGSAVLLEAGTMSMSVYRKRRAREADVHDNVLGNVDSKLADTGAAKLLHDPIAAARQILLLLVGY